MRLRKPFLALVLASVALFGASWAFAAGTPARVGDFALLDQQGTQYQLSYYGDHQAVVIVMHGIGDPAVGAALPGLLKLRDAYAEQGVKFFMLNAQLEDDRDSIAREATAQAHGLPILLDETQLVAASLGAQRTAEAFVIDPKSMTIIYRGPADDSLRAALAGQSVAATSATGSPIHYSSQTQAATASISYSKDIAPILEKN